MSKEKVDKEALEATKKIKSSKINNNEIVLKDADNTRKPKQKGKE